MQLCCHAADLIMRPLNQVFQVNAYEQVETESLHISPPKKLRVPSWCLACSLFTGSITEIDTVIRYNNNNHHHHQWLYSSCKVHGRLTPDVS
jgi:hypothetical protein